MICQLNPPLPMDTPKGPAWAHFMIDPSQNHHIQWVCFLRENGQCWTFQNPQIRLAANYTMGTGSDLPCAKIFEPDADGFAKSLAKQ